MLLFMSTVACVLTALVALELLARAWLRTASHPYVWKPGLHLEMHPRRDVLPQLSQVTTLKANSLGIRADEIKPADSTYRIVAAGGSGVECFALDQTEAWPEIVANLIQSSPLPARRGKSAVQTLNTGKSGFTNETLCYLLPRLMPRIGKVDVMLVMTGASAVTLWAKMGTPSVPPTSVEPWQDLHWHSEQIYDWSPRNLAIVELIRRFWYTVRARKVVMNATGGSLKDGRASYARATSKRETTGDPTQWLTNYEVSLESIVAASRPWARHVVLICQPWLSKPDLTAEEEAMLWQGYVGDARPAERTEFYSNRVLKELFDLTEAAIDRVGARLGVPVIRPAEEIEQSSATYYDHCHITPIGSKQMAEYVARKIQEIELAVDAPATLIAEVAA